jgi:ATP-dependent exoDNAse (exonuclease V) alpha subunit
MRLLLIGENCRVILRRNIDISKGLCNGRLGFVKKIIFSNDGSVQSLDVIFDGDKTVSNIVKTSSKFEITKNIYATRSQFPLSLAWAIKIHKSHSLSLDGLIVDLGKSIFEPCMAYVALS